MAGIRQTKSSRNIRIPLYKRLASYVYPISLRRAPGDTNNQLEIFLYHGRLQLITTDAMYSDGDKYQPATASVKYLRDFLPAVKKVLLLGTGLGSMVYVMNSRGYEPQFTIVDNDEVVLRWAAEMFEDNGLNNIQPVCSDARDFMARNKEKFDLIFIDVFNGRFAPAFVYGNVFLQHCHDSCAVNGKVVFNFIINSRDEWQMARNNFAEVFPDHHIIDLGLNQVLIG